MKIYYNLDRYFLIVDKNTQHCETIYDSAFNIVHSMTNKDILFVGEEHFCFTSTYVSHYASKPYTLSDQKQRIQQHVIKERKNNPSLGQLLHFELFNLVINGDKEQFILGKVGQIQFNLNCIYTQAHSDLDSDYLINNGIEFLPSSYPTVIQTRNQFPNQAYHLLYINTHSTKIISVSNGFYKSTYSINIGTQVLKTMYQEQHIPKIYRDPSKINPINLDIAKEVSSFFAQQIIDRIKSVGIDQGNMIVISDLTKNYILMDALKSQYSTNIGGYIVPLSDTGSKGFMPIDLVNYIQTHTTAGNIK